MEIKEYRERVAELALDDTVSDQDFWAQETQLAEEVLKLRIYRAGHRLDPTTGEPRDPAPVKNVRMIEDVELPEPSAEATIPDDQAPVGPWWNHENEPESD